MVAVVSLMYIILEAKHSGKKYILKNHIIFTQIMMVMYGY